MIHVYTYIYIYTWMDEYVHAEENKLALFSTLTRTQTTESTHGPTRAHLERGTGCHAELKQDTRLGGSVNGAAVQNRTPIPKAVRDDALLPAPRCKKESMETMQKVA